MARRFTCSKCQEDITESYQADEPNVGIVGGWFCEKCNEGYTDEGEPDWNDDDVHVHLDYSKDQTPQVERCPKHPEVVPEMGYGLAGGGIGVYSYCPVCGSVLNKTQDHT